MNSKYIIIKMIVSRFLQTDISAQGLLQQTGPVILKTKYLKNSSLDLVLALSCVLETKYEL